MPTGRDNRSRGEPPDACATQRTGCGQCTSAAGEAAPSGCRLVGWRKWLLRIALLVVSPLAVLAILEGVLWVAGFGYPTGFLISPDGGATWTENPRFAWRFSPRTVAAEPEPIRLAAVKPAGALRIVVLGESAAYGTPEPAYNFGRILQTMLRERHPGAAVEVVNAAVMPWSPFTTTPSRLASYRPLIRAGLWAKATRVGQWVESARPPERAEHQGIETFVGSAIAPGDPRLGIVHDHFRANLEEIIQIAQGAGVRVVAATVATNLRNFAPLASRHRTDLGTDDLAAWDRWFAAGAAAVHDGRLSEAAENYRRALAVDDRFAEAHFQFGWCLLALGRNDEARRHFILARDFDALPFRAVGPLNSIVRDVAAGREAAGVYLVDAEAALDAAAQRWGGIAGEESFYEHCHLNFVGNYRLAAAMLPTVEAAIGAIAAAGQAPSITRCAELLAFTEWDAYRMDMDIAKCMAKPPFTGKSDYAERLDQIRRHAAGLAARETAEVLKHQIQVYEEALRHDPNDYYLHHKFALLKTDTNDPAGAAAEWREVLRLMPHNLEARVCLGDILARQGRKDEAVALWSESLRDRPGCLHAINRMAVEMAAEGKLEEAAGWVEQAIEIRPDACCYGQLGSLLARQGKADKAIEQYRRGLARFPDDIGLRQSLAEALAAQKEHEAAAAEFEKVLRADPDHIAARCGLARALGALGRTDEAATHWRVALALNPAIKEAREELGRLPPGAGLDSILNAAKMAHIGDDKP
ncbi:MAG: tetratricopeptide repeat protein [Planctomycetota bacterium]|nr:tetratricopeptide repeat protein [Planctomycetota bacterium]